MGVPGIPGNPMLKIHTLLRTSINMFSVTRNHSNLNVTGLFPLIIDTSSSCMYVQMFYLMDNGDVTLERYHG